MIHLTFNDGGLELNLEKAPGVMSVHIQRWLTEVMARLHRMLNQNMSGGLIGRRSGNLMRSLLENVTVTDKSFKAEIWPDPDKAIYGTIQEFGGTVLPKHGQFLAIPLAAMNTGNGVARATAHQVRDNPEAYGFKSTFIPKGKHVIMGVPLGSRKNIVPLFALKPSVVIPGRHYMETTLTQNWSWIADRLEKITGEATNVIFKIGGGSGDPRGYAGWMDKS